MKAKITLVGLKENQKYTIFDNDRDNFFQNLQYFEHSYPDPVDFVWREYFTTLLMLGGYESFKNEFGRYEGCNTTNPSKGTELDSCPDYFVIENCQSILIMID